MWLVNQIYGMSASEGYVLLTFFPVSKHWNTWDILCNKNRKKKNTCPSAPLTASSASWLVSYVTNPNPLLRFESRSFTIFTCNKKETVWQQLYSILKTLWPIFTNFIKRKQLKMITLLKKLFSFYSTFLSPPITYQKMINLQEKLTENKP